MQTVGLHSFRLTRQDAATVLRTWIPLNTLPRPVVCQWGWSLFGRNPSHHIIPSLLILFASLSSFLLLLFLFSFCFLFLFFPFLPSFFMLLFFLYNSFQTYVVFIFDCGTCALLGCPPRVQPNETHGQMCTLHRRGNALSLSLFAWCVCVLWPFHALCFATIHKSLTLWSVTKITTTKNHCDDTNHCVTVYELWQWRLSTSIYLSVRIVQTSGTLLNSISTWKPLWSRVDGFVVFCVTRVVRLCGNS